ncbi:predicted protein [Arabidopsis lyrata subsp. lyrata]|uniref:Predicted protein n=1 Tax=Arabidopsis lyrata subsp. lyrata TaxID=81972 RepID=D7M0N7_ARALL|nr:predicted protein [Arabidopsis lyrata subsp. lyrata]
MFLSCRLNCLCGPTLKELAPYDPDCQSRYANKLFDSTSILCVEAVMPILVPNTVEVRLCSVSKDPSEMNSVFSFHGYKNLLVRGSLGVGAFRRIYINICD